MQAEGVGRSQPRRWRHERERSQAAEPSAAQRAGEVADAVTLIAMSLATELEAFRVAAAAAGMTLASTPARVCGATRAEYRTGVSLARADGSPSEQFFKWQLVSAIIRAGLVPADSIGCELSVPRGSRGSSALFVDVAIFSDPSWAGVYDAIKAGTPGVSWDDLFALLVACGEIKDDPRDDIERTLARQLIPALNAVSVGYALGFYFNAGHLVLLARSTDLGGVSILRLDPAVQGPSGSVTARLNPYVPDPYLAFPSLATIQSRAASLGGVSRAGRTVNDLDVMSSRNQRPVETALDRINRVLDSTSLRAETGYRIVIETLAAKVFDEKRSATGGTGPLDFYVDPGETLAPAGGITGAARTFRDRLQRLHAAAQPSYPSILHNSAINWNSPSHVRVVAEVVAGFQDMSFVRSSSSDLYQVVFYNFAGPLSKIAQAQFMTPLRVIEFMVGIANPKAGETVLDPTMGIADFLAVTFTSLRNAGQPVQDTDLYGVDNDSSMLMLAALNMLLNGDGGAHLYYVPDTGSLDHKLVVEAATGTTVAKRLDPAANANGAWAFASGSGFILRTFDVVLTNPPFGEGRALRLNDPTQGAVNREIASMHDTHRAMGGLQIDKGILFLENACHVMSTPGRFGIILSTALASVAEYERARAWLRSQVRVVATFDLPKDTFAETGVPTTLVFGYRCRPERLRELQAAPYQVFSRTISRVGFVKVTRNRNTLLVPKFLVDPRTGRVQHHPLTGEPLIDEEFTETVDEFRAWARTQEPELQALFL